MKTISSKEIKESLESQIRVYLCGDLHQESNLRHIATEGFELGISDYKDYTFEKAHIHRFNHEYNYVLEGQIKIFLLREKREYLFEKGDLFVIEPDEPYVGKSAAGTRTLFAKVPGGNDKVMVPMPEVLMHWGLSWDSDYREESAK